MTPAYVWWGAFLYGVGAGIGFWAIASCCIYQMMHPRSSR